MVTDNDSQETGAGGDESATAGIVNAVIKTDKGDIELELYSDVAPKTVENFTKLSKDGFYDGTKFHRVISDFMIQAGDPQSRELDITDPRLGTGGPGYVFEDEINPEALGLAQEVTDALIAMGYVFDSELESMPVNVGTIAMANAGPNTNGSQFFIVTQQDQTHLNGLHTVFGKVVAGMDVVTSIEKGDMIESIEIK